MDYQVDLPHAFAGVGELLQELAVAAAALVEGRAVELEGGVGDGGLYDRGIQRHQENI